MVTFAHSVANVSRPLAAVEAVLSGYPAAWLPDLVDQVGKASPDLLMRVAPALDTYRFPIREEVRVHGPMRFQRDGKLRLAMDFRGSDAGAIFAAAEADLEADAQDTGSSRVELHARFTTSSDWACDRRVFRWMIQDYTRRLGARIGAHLLGSAAA